MKKRITAIACVTTLVLGVAWLFARASSSDQRSARPTPTMAPSSPSVGSLEKLPSSSIRSWQVYSNEKLGLSILYPSGWFVHEEERSRDVGELIDFTPVPVREPSRVIPSLWIEVVPKQTGIELDEWIETHVLHDLPPRIRSTVDIRSYQLKSRTGFQVTALPGILPTLQYFFASSSKVYRITISPYEPENPDFQNVSPDVLQLRDVMISALKIEG